MPIGDDIEAHLIIEVDGNHVGNTYDRDSHCIFKWRILIVAKHFADDELAESRIVKPRRSGSGSSKAGWAYLLKKIPKLRAIIAGINTWECLLART
jgi:hypothetical protein